MSRLLRERGLALAALILALVGLLSGGGGSGAAQARVIVVAQGVAADVAVPRAAVRVAQIEARDLTPGMATRADQVVGRTARVRLVAGDYVLRSALADHARSPILRLGERAVPISIDPAAAPPLSMLRAGRTWTSSPSTTPTRTALPEAG